MTLFDKIACRVKKILGIEKLSENPNSERYQFISNIETVRKQHLDEYRIWFTADSDELDNFYLTRVVSGFAKEPIYNRNKRQSFWALSEKECDIKKIHTGIPRASVLTLVNCLDNVKITCEGYQDKIDRILEANNFNSLLNQESRPLTLVEGDGAFKVIFNKEISPVPLIEYYEAQDIEVIMKSTVVVGIIYKDYYKYQNKDYVLLEIRRVENGNSIIEYELYRFSKSDEVERVDLCTIPELSKLPEDGYVIEGIGAMFGVQSKFFHNPLDKGRGLSIFAGKIDIMDDMDMIASVESLTEKNSGPVDYYPVDALKRDKNGKPIFPKVFGRKFVKKPSVAGPNGEMDSKIDTSAPDLNFVKYSDALTSKTLLFLSGLLSPASMGIDIAKKDNAEAQREKEKVTMMTRNNIIANEMQQIKKLMKICLMLQEYMDTGEITITDYDISVKYSEFASPTFETKSQTLYPMWTAGAISDEMYVDKLYGDSLSDIEKQHEIDALKQNKQSDSMDLGALMGDENGNNQDLPTENEEPSDFDKLKA